MIIFGKMFTLRRHCTRKNQGTQGSPRFLGVGNNIPKAKIIGRGRMDAQSGGGLWESSQEGRKKAQSDAQFVANAGDFKEEGVQSVKTGESPAYPKEGENGLRGGDFGAEQGSKGSSMKKQKRGGALSSVVWEGFQLVL